MAELASESAYHMRIVDVFEQWLQRIQLKNDSHWKTDVQVGRDVMHTTKQPVGRYESQHIDTTHTLCHHINSHPMI